MARRESLTSLPPNSYTDAVLSTSLLKRGSGAGWRGAVVALAAIALLTSSAWGAPLAREEDLPHLLQLPIFQPGEPSLLYDDEGRALGPIVPEYRIVVPLSRIPLKLRQAIIAAEDARFYEHGALDLKGIARAAVRNLMSGSVKEGGSTITQQLAKTLFLSHERTIGRKMKELQLAGELEQSYTKDQILEMYLNSIYFGHGAYGAEAAARITRTRTVAARSHCTLCGFYPVEPDASRSRRCRRRFAEAAWEAGNARCR